MATPNVIFKQGTQAQYDALKTKDPNTLYWIYDTLTLFKGNECYATGAVATNLASGLLSAQDKAKLDLLSTEPMQFKPVDATVLVNQSDDTVSFGVNISKEKDNALFVKEDGLYVAPSQANLVWEDMR